MDNTSTQGLLPEAQQAAENFWSKNKIIFKGIFITFLSLFLLIPQLFIAGLVNERSSRKESVINEVSDKWARDQTITGPIIVLPYYQTYKNEKGELSNQKDYAYFMPENLELNGELFPETRRRSIFKVSVYKANLLIKGNFNKMVPAQLGIADDKLLWSEAKLLMAISDSRGLDKRLLVNFNGQSLELNSWLGVNDVFENAFACPIQLSPQSISGNYAFSCNLELKGAQQINFVPVGAGTAVYLKSSTPKPNFQGKHAADYKIGDSAYKGGFEANWHVLDINRKFPQQWKSSNIGGQNISSVFMAETFGVRLMSGLDSYSKTNRAVKYALLVIFLTFLVYFFTEIFQKKSVHLVQYTLVGIALVLFYTLLLSIGEYLEFNGAYLIAFLATVSLIAFYTKSIFEGWRTTILFSAFLSIIYLFIFMLIQLEDSALLVGSIGLFMILAAIMYISQKIQWNKK